MLVSIAQVALGGGIVQGVLAFFRRRPELRQLDNQADSTAVETADQLVRMLRTELGDAKTEVTELRRQVGSLGDRLVKSRSDLVLARAEADRLAAENAQLKTLLTQRKEQP